MNRLFALRAGPRWLPVIQLLMAAAGRPELIPFLTHAYVPLAVASAQRFWRPSQR